MVQTHSSRFHKRFIVSTEITKHHGRSSKYSNRHFAFDRKDKEGKQQKNDKYFLRGSHIDKVDAERTKSIQCILEKHNGKER